MKSTLFILIVGLTNVALASEEFKCVVGGDFSRQTPWIQFPWDMESFLKSNCDLGKSFSVSPWTTSEQPNTPRSFLICCFKK